jgi:uncharacterized protein
MVSRETIIQAVGILREAADVERILLFGSYARGDATDQSDVDLLVVLREVSSTRDAMFRLRRLLLPLAFPVDVVVVSGEIFHKWSEAPGTVLYWAKREGQVLYAAA